MSTITSRDPGAWTHGIKCSLALAAILAPSLCHPQTIDDPFNVLCTFTNWGSPNTVLLSGSTLYGPTSAALFKVNTDGTGFGVLKVFSAATEGSYPNPVVASGATLYGTCAGGGPYYHGAGSIYKINTDGSGYALLSYVDGAYASQPSGPLALSGSTLYGTMRSAGSNNFYDCHGAVFKINTDGSGFALLKVFTNIDGSTPAGGVTLSGNTLYGTTIYDYAGEYDAGSIFKINTDGSGYTVLAHLTAAQGRQPPTPLIVSGTTIYGAALGGGEADKGTIFTLNTDGSGFNVIKQFNGPPDDGSGPNYLVLVGSRLYGATWRGGPLDYGTLFMLNTDGSGYTVLKQFDQPAPAAIYPVATAFSHMTLYGTTYWAGPTNSGEVFSLTFSAPTLNSTMQSQTAELGSTVIFTADVSGFPPPNLAWFFNGFGPVASGTNLTLVLPGVGPAQIGAYTVIASNTFGAITNPPAMLSVIPPVSRKPARAVGLTGFAGSTWNVEYTDALGLSAHWINLGTVTLAGNSGYCFDASDPLPPQRFYRARQAGSTNPPPNLNLNVVSAIVLTGNVGDSVEVEGINAVGPTNAWFTIDTVTLTNASQFFFDVSAIGQPPRLYRLVNPP